MKKALILSLDMGTSSVRAMLFDVRGKAVPGVEAQIPYAQRTTADGGVFTDAEVLLEQTVRCIRDLLGKLDKDALGRLAGVGISCFWHSLVGVGADGRAVTPVFSWADTRAHAQAEALKTEFPEDDYHARTGCVLHPCFWPAKLRWLHQTDPETFGRAGRWMSFGEYVALRLFGSASCAIGMASATGLFDQNATGWDETILAALPITADHLNPLVERDQPQTGLRPEFARVLRPLAAVPWFPAVGDGACSNVGCGAVTAGRVALNVGTSAAMRILVEADRVDIPPGLFCYRADRKRFLIGGAFANGGNAYAWLNGALLLGDRKVESRRLGTMPPDGHGLTILPLWAGERSPNWHIGARATVTGMNLHTTPQDILRASLEALAYQYAAVRDMILALPTSLCGGGAGSVPAVIASGGALLHDNAWIQIMADVFGAPLTSSRVFEASSRGAALLAAQSLGLIADLDDPPFYDGKVYKPDLGRHDVYQRARARYEGLYHTMFP